MLQSQIIVSLETADVIKYILVTLKKKKIWMYDAVQKVTRSNKEVDNRAGLEWFVNAIKDSKGITRKVTI